jgi:hypothetical protein
MALVVAEGNGMIMTQTDRSNRRKSCHRVTSSKTNFEWTNLGTNSGLHFDRTATTNTTEKTYNPSLINSFLSGLLLAMCFDFYGKQEISNKIMKKCNLNSTH